MEDSLENWISHMVMEDDDVFNQSSNSSLIDGQEFLREIILQRPDFSPECEPSPYPCSKIQDSSAAGIVELGGATSPTKSTLSSDETSFNHGGSDTLHKSNSSNSIMSLERCACSCPATYLLSFDKSSVEPIIHEPTRSHKPLLGSKRRTIEKDGGFELEPKVHRATKKVGRSSETQDHLMAERKRRRELTQSIIALSATIPGLKKMDKAYVLREAVNYMKQLQERVKELENQNKDKRVQLQERVNRELGNQNKDKRVNSAIFIRKSKASSNKSATYCETNTESLLEVEARVLEKEVLIRIHCEKQKDIVLKIHALLEKLHLSIASSSVLPFGPSILVIDTIAQMDGEYSMTMDDLVKNLKKYLLEAY